MYQSQSITYSDNLRAKSQNYDKSTCVLKLDMATSNVKVKHDKSIYLPLFDAKKLKTNNLPNKSKRLLADKASGSYPTAVTAAIVRGSHDKLMNFLAVVKPSHVFA
ncbi:hypothetical protein NIES4101_29510 [Calothrix sp. NIES-4101]|nr:hypothetical protein NIES4101_29510 [Calothrix sp. NIES-4101]